MNNNFKKNRGFTLIELLVVIAIISLISAIVLNNVAASRMKAADTKVAEDLRQVKIAAELYYLDNKEYPPVTLNPYKSIAEVESFLNKNVLTNKLAFFIKTAEAQGVSSHPKTKLCDNFDKIAQNLVSKKYLAQIPVHPYDNDDTGVCYKAVKTAKTFVAYGALTQLVNTDKGEMSKRSGFIVGDASKSSLDEIRDYYTPTGEIVYPIGVDGQDAFDISGNLDSVDAIEGITGGAGSGNTTTSTTTATTTATTTPNTPGSSMQNPIVIAQDVPGNYNLDSITSGQTIYFKFSRSGGYQWLNFNDNSGATKIVVRSGWEYPVFEVTGTPPEYGCDATMYCQKTWEEAYQFTAVNRTNRIISITKY